MTAAADRPVENSGASPKAHDLIARYFQSVVAYHGEAHHDFEDTQSRAVAMGERDGDLAEYIASLEAETARLKSPRPVENSELREWLDEFSRISDPRSPMAGVAQSTARRRIEELFASLTQEIEGKRIAFAFEAESRASLQAEISRLRADRLTEEEAAFVFHGFTIDPETVFEYPHAYQNSAVEKLRRISGSGSQ